MKKILIIICGSFTTIMLLFALFSSNDFAPPLTRATVIQGFVMSVTISLLMAAAERIMVLTDVSSLLADILIRILICYLVVYSEGCLFGMIEFGWVGLLHISPVLLLTFIITYAISYLTCAEWAQAINKSIRRKR